MQKPRQRQNNGVFLEVDGHCTLSNSLVLRSQNKTFNHLGCVQINEGTRKCFRVCLFFKNYLCFYRTCFRVWRLYSHGNIRKQGVRLHDKEQKWTTMPTHCPKVIPKWQTEFKIRETGGGNISSACCQKASSQNGIPWGCILLLALSIDLLVSYLAGPENSTFGSCHSTD